MRLEKLRQVDLNLLVAFAAIAEERSVTAAAARLALSQPATSRALQRARAMFHDELLVRAPSGFTLTIHGQKLLDELTVLLPKMERLIAPAVFDPMRDRSHFRLAGPDNVCTVVVPRLCRQFAEGRFQTTLEFIPWQGGMADLLDRGQVDLALHIDDGLLPAHFQSERLYREDWICAVARGSAHGQSLSLKEYLAASHIVVRTIAGVQSIPDKQLAAIGVKRAGQICLPYFGAALQSLPGTELVLTVTSGMTAAIQADRRLRLARAPHELQPFHFLMAWHPRNESDARHLWLRDVVRSAASSVTH